MFKRFAAVIVTILALVSSGMAKVPRLINYQGVLTDAAGAPVNGARSIQFALFETETGGTAFWSETHSVDVADGLFNVILGSVTVMDSTAFEPDSVYLEITVGEDGPMTPRQRLVSVMSAFYADHADHADDTDRLNGYTAGAFVRTINAVAPAEGEVTLVGGENVTVTPDAENHTVTISAEGGGTTGDNLGNHSATRNIKLNDHWLSNDGGDEGIQIDNSGNVSMPGNFITHGNFNAVGSIQSNSTITAISSINSNGFIRTGIPASTYESGDIVSTDDLLADDDIIAGDRVTSGGNMICGNNMGIENHLGVNMGGGYSTSYALQVSGSTYSTVDIISGGKLISGGHCGINFGGTSVTYALRVAGDAYSTGSWTSSDLNLKKNIADAAGPAAKLFQLRGVSYEWKREENPDREFTAGVQYGLIAQELEKVFPEMVKTDENGEKAVAYYQLIPLLLEAVKKQQEQIDTLQKLVGQTQTVRE